MSELSGVLVYPRDASWYDYPNASDPKKLHQESTNQPGTPKCRPNRILLVMELPQAASDVRPASLCRRCFPRDRA